MNTTLDLHPTNFYMTYTDVALIHECVEVCLDETRSELDRLQRLPERDEIQKERLRWLQSRNRALRTVYVKLTKEMNDYGAARD